MYTKFQIINDHSVILQERTSFILFSSSLAFLIFFALSSSAFSFSTSSLFKRRNQKFLRTFYQTFSTWVSTAIFPRLRQFLICQIVPLSRGIRWWSHSSQVPRSSRCYPHLRTIKFENIFFVWRTKLFPSPMDLLTTMDDFWIRMSSFLLFGLKYLEIAGVYGIELLVILISEFFSILTLLGTLNSSWDQRCYFNFIKFITNSITFFSFGVSLSSLFTSW